MIPDTSGPRPLESFASYDPTSRSWRTSQVTFLSGLEMFSETWPTSGMMRNGVCFRREAWEPPIAETASLSWPTPTATDATMGGMPERIPPHVLDSPTPVAGHNVSLQHAVRIWATPTANVAKNIGPNINYATRLAKGHLDGQVAAAEGIGGGLNPTWVEWLMGFPIGHTDLGPWEMPSSRKLRKSSDAASSPSTED